TQLHTLSLHDALPISIATASGVLGRPVRIKVVPSGTPEPMTSPSRTGSNGSGRSRAEQDAVVRRMQEKFGAEIRTIIDYREKRRSEEHTSELQSRGHL